MKKKFIVAFLASLVCFTLLYSTVLSSVFNRPASAVTDDPNDLNNETSDINPKVKDEILFLLLGVDAQSVKKSKGTRTDTMMLTKVNFETGEINILSIPRDTRVYVNGKQDKINAAHAYGGADLTLETVNDFLGLDIDYYVKIDYNIVQEVVEKIGGVTIDVPFDMKYKDPTAKPPLDINIKKGVQTLDGKNAHDFLRWRHNNSYTVGYKDGDVGSIKAQQYFMKELVKQTLKPKNLLKLPGLIEAYFTNVETNIPLGTMLKAAASANKIDTEKMVTETVPGEGKYIGDISYYIYDREKIDILVNEMFENYLN